MPLETPSALSVKRPLRIQNMEKNTTVFTKTVNGNALRIVLTAHGTANDTQRVPLDLAEDIDFLNSLEMGIIKVIDGPDDVVAFLRVEAERVRTEREEQAQRAMAVIDRRQDRDIVGATCIGPAPQGRTGNCGRALLQSARQQGEVPPLCPEHEHLAPNFHLVETGSKGEGATESRDGVVRREWRQAVITERKVAAQ